MNKNKVFTTSNIAKIAILSALSFILMLYDFPLPIIPPFYKIDFSEVVILVGGFAMGPAAAVLIEVFKILFKSMTGTQTAYIGEIANLLIGISFVAPAAYIYQQHKTKKSALIGLIIGGLSMTVLGVALNYFVLLPAYSHYYNLPMEAIIDIGSKTIPAITNRLTFVLFATTPFNLIKVVVVSLITLLIYKHISPILKK